MQLACPDCGSRFRVPSGALGEAGRKVRCAKCRYEWFAEPKDLILDPMDADDAHTMHTESEPDSAEPVAERSDDHPSESVDSVPAEIIKQWDFADKEIKPSTLNTQHAQKDKAKNVLWLWVANGALAALVLLMSVWAFPSTFGFLTGYRDTSGLSLAGLALTELKMGSKMRYGLSGKIVNVSDTTQPLPQLSIAIVDRQGEIAREWSFEQPGKIEPGQEIPFNQTALDNRAGPKNHAIVVQIGSAGELSMRR